MATKLDFMASDEFRDVLEADLKEMRACFESNAWKATHVLAGSIVEAVSCGLHHRGRVHRER